jgi:threonylcarbamoyladenosine tRNA methylthiotransferase MtaB
MKIAITTLGCKINQYDSAVIQNRLEHKHSFVPFDDEADCYVINTCTVTDRADWEARQLVRRAKRLNPTAKVLVTGCYAQVNPDEVARVAGVDYVVGLNRLDDLLRYVESAPLVETQVAVSEVKRERGVPVLGTTALPGHTRAFLKIQEGCNYTCTYCIIPTARGLSRSVAPRQVLQQVRQLAGAGYREIVLTGIHLGGYGQDLQPKLDLTALVEQIAESGLMPRLRLSSLDPREVPDRLLDLMARSETICPHLHICAQAGDDAILKAMRRNYDTAYFRDLLARVRQRLPEAALGSDIIVGFPGESEADFESTIAYLRHVEYDHAFLFAYSGREGTRAARWSETVSSEEKQRRLQAVIALQEHISAQRSARWRGRRVEVLVEGAARRGEGWLSGKTAHFKTTVFPSRSHAAGEFVNVDVVQSTAHTLIGQPAREEAREVVAGA